MTKEELRYWHTVYIAAAEVLRIKNSDLYCGACVLEAAMDRVGIEAWDSACENDNLVRDIERIWREFGGQGDFSGGTIGKCVTGRIPMLFEYGDFSLLERTSPSRGTSAGSKRPTRRRKSSRR